MSDAKKEDCVATQQSNETRRDESRVRAGFWQTAKRAARYIPFMEEVVAAYYCALDWKTPMRVKGILFASLAYFVLPTDAIPDFLLGVGFTDDIAVLSAAIASIRQHIKPAHRLAARQALQSSS